MRNILLALSIAALTVGCGGSSSGNDGGGGPGDGSVDSTKSPADVLNTFSTATVSSSEDINGIWLAVAKVTVEKNESARNAETDDLLFSETITGNEENIAVVFIDNEGDDWEICSQEGTQTINCDDDSGQIVCSIEYDETFGGAEYSITFDSDFKNASGTIESDFEETYRESDDDYPTVAQVEFAEDDKVDGTIAMRKISNVLLDDLTSVITVPQDTVCVAVGSKNLTGTFTDTLGGLDIQGTNTIVKQELVIDLGYEVEITNTVITGNLTADSTPVSFTEREIEAELSGTDTEYQKPN
jgi:hypothetical protein